MWVWFLRLPRKPNRDGLTYVEGEFVEWCDPAVLGHCGEREAGEGKVDQVLLVTDTAQLKQLHVITLHVFLLPRKQTNETLHDHKQSYTCIIITAKRSGLNFGSCERVKSSPIHSGDI